MYQVTAANLYNSSYFSTMYQLTAADLYNPLEDDTPVIRAAANANSAILEALLARYAHLKELTKDKELPQHYDRMISLLSPNTCVNIYRRIQSPIKAATAASLPDNVRLLLAAGADPNGIPREHLQSYSVPWIRGRSRDAKYISETPSICRGSNIIAAQIENSITHQICPLTEAELDERRYGFVRFWTEPNFPGQSIWTDRAVTALEAAAAMGNIEIFDLVRAAGADESAWLQSAPDSDNPATTHLFDLGGGDEVPMSALSVSSPIHEAIAAGYQPMLHHLLSTCGYSPNYCPRAAPTVALPPLSYIIARCDINKAGVQKCLVDLLSHPLLNINIRTPIFQVHLLHFATAHHNPELLSWLAGYVPGGLKVAGVTALGHTLLCIASLPLTASQIVPNTTRIAQSMHCVRTLDSKWLAHRIPSPDHRLYPEFAYKGLHKPEPLTEPEQRAQTNTIRLLLEWGGDDVRAQDHDGNTALHYLAGTLNIAKETIKLVREMTYGEQVWHETRNHWGFTPSDLWEEQTIDCTNHVSICS